MVLFTQNVEYMFTSLQFVRKEVMDLGDLDSMNFKKYYDHSDSTYDAYQGIDFFDGVEGMEDVKPSEEPKVYPKKEENFELFDDIDFMDGVEEDYDLLDHPHTHDRINETRVYNKPQQKNPTVRLKNNATTSRRTVEKKTTTSRRTVEKKASPAAATVHMERQEEHRQAKKKHNSIFKSLGFYCIVVTIGLALVVLIFFMQLFSNSGTTSQSSYQDAVEQDVTK